MKAILLSIAMAAFSNSWEMTESVVPDTCAECEKYCNDILCLGTCFKKDISGPMCACRHQDTKETYCGDCPVHLTTQ